MGCEHRDGMIICSRGARPIRCHVCGVACDKLCDFPLAGAKAGHTCDKPMCPRHSIHIEGQDLDYCLTHARMKGLIE